MIARKFVLQNKVVGAPQPLDFKLIEETLPSELQDGGKDKGPDLMEPILRM
jgi:hypothetical protein